MNWHWLAALAWAVALNATAQVPSPAATWHGYDEAASARADIERALSEAVASGRRALVVFGANWCGDCRVLDMAMKQGRLKALVEAKFVVVKVDVARFDKNVEIAQRFGVPLKLGIPAVAVLAADGSASFVTSGGELANARSMGEEALLALFGRAF